MGARASRNRAGATVGGDGEKKQAAFFFVTSPSISTRIVTSPSISAVKGFIRCRYGDLP